MKSMSFDQLIVKSNEASRLPNGDPHVVQGELKKNVARKNLRKGNHPEMINPDQESMKKLGFKGKGVYALLFKLWLRGIHHKCSRALFFAYCDEFWFRQRHRTNRAKIFDTSLSRVLHATPHPYSVLRCDCS